MDLINGEYVGISPIGGIGMAYHIAAYDNAGNMAESSEYSFTVTGIDPTGTSTDTSTDTTAITDLLRDNWEMIAIVAGLLFVLVVCMLLRKRR